MERHLPKPKNSELNGRKKENSKNDRRSVGGSDIAYSDDTIISDQNADSGQDVSHATTDDIYTSRCRYGQGKNKINQGGNFRGCGRLPQITGRGR